MSTGCTAGGVAEPVPSKRTSEVARPDGAQPPRSSERVPRGRGHPSRTPPSPPALRVDLTRADASHFGAVGATEDAIAVLDPVSDDAAPAVLADRGDLLDGAFERVVGPDRILVSDLHRPSDSRCRRRHIAPWVVSPIGRSFGTAASRGRSPRGRLASASMAAVQIDASSSDILPCGASRASS